MLIIAIILFRELQSISRKRSSEFSKWGCRTKTDESYDSLYVDT